MWGPTGGRKPQSGVGGSQGLYRVVDVASYLSAYLAAPRDTMVLAPWLHLGLLPRGDQHSLCRPSCTPCPPAMPHACTRHWSATFSSTTSTATPCPLPAASVCRCVPGAPSSSSRLGKRNDCRLEGWRGPRGSVADCPSFAPAEAAASLACGLCASQSHGVLRWGQRAGIALTSRGSWCSRAWRWRAGRGTLA